MDSLPWYALQVRPRFEKIIASTLLNKGYEGFLPLYRHRSRWSDRIKGVLHVVGIGKTPHPVDDDEIAALQTIVLSSLQAEPRAYLAVGRKVRIEIGPLAGVEGILAALKGAHRLVVSVSLLQRSVSVEIDESWVVPVSPIIPLMPPPVPPHFVNHHP
jgi:hypothetical protein